MLAFDGASIRPASLGEAFRPFGERPVAGAALYLGFTVVGAPGATLSLLFEAASDDDPAPVSEGGAPPPSDPRPILRWEALTGRGFAAADVARDESAQASRTGIAVLKLADDWTAGRPKASADGAPLHWLRLRLASGEMRNPPRLANIHPHVVEAKALETHRDEFPVPEPAGRGSFVRLARSPVLADSVVLEVDEGVASAGLFDFEEDDEGNRGEGAFRRWKRVDSLAGQRPDARVFTLDSAEGIIRFGDHREGMAPPPGIRNIAVRSYATTLGAGANVGTGEIGRMASPLAGIQSVSNPLPASGGSDLEAIGSAVALGPARVKARERAVTADDVALLATEAEGADIVRAYALPCGDPAFPGAVRPGTTGIFVIARRHPRAKATGPPLASSETLAAVAAHLSGRSAPIGARIVVANPRFHRILVQGTITVAEGRDSGAAMTAAGGALDRYLNPELGGWSIGATIRHSALVHVVLGASPDIVSVPFLSVTVDGIVHSACSDVALSRFGLPWPGRHRLLALAEGAGS
jgi:predicted phage baseplate assembly protein